MQLWPVVGSACVLSVDSTICCSIKAHFLNACNTSVPYDACIFSQNLMCSGASPRSHKTNLQDHLQFYSCLDLIHTDLPLLTSVLFLLLDAPPQFVSDASTAAAATW